MINKHTLIVGGTKGTGLEIANMLSSKRHKISIVGRTKPDVNHMPKNCHFMSLDLLDMKSIKSVLDNIISKNGKIDNMIFCQRYRGKKDEWSGEISVSLSATKEIIELMTDSFNKKGDKSIVFISSIASEFIVKEQALSYHIAKAGIASMTKYFSVNLGKKGIRVNCVTPCTIVKEESKEFYKKNQTIQNMYKNISPIGRMITSKDVANLVSFLCSEKASGINGQNIFVDGGISNIGQEALSKNIIEKQSLIQGV